MEGTFASRYLDGWSWAQAAMMSAHFLALRSYGAESQRAFPECLDERSWNSALGLFLAIATYRALGDRARLRPCSDGVTIPGSSCRFERSDWPSFFLSIALFGYLRLSCVGIGMAALI